MDNDDEKLDINLEAAPSLGAEEEKYEATLGKPYEDFTAEENDKPQTVEIPEEVKNRSSGSKVLLFGILFSVFLLGFSVMLACFGAYAGSVVYACAFVIFVVLFFTLLAVNEKNALSGKNVLDKDGTRRIMARVTYVTLQSSRERVLRARGRIYKRETVSAVYKITLSADGNYYTALSNKYYRDGSIVFAYVNGKKAFIDATENEE